MIFQPQHNDQLLARILNKSKKQVLAILQEEDHNFLNWKVKEFHQAATSQHFNNSEKTSFNKNYRQHHTNINEYFEFNRSIVKKQNKEELKEQSYPLQICTNNENTKLSTALTSDIKNPVTDRRKQWHSISKIGNNVFNFYSPFVSQKKNYSDPNANTKLHNSFSQVKFQESSANMNWLASAKIKKAPSINYGCRYNAIPTNIIPSNQLSIFKGSLQNYQKDVSEVMRYTFKTDKKAKNDTGLYQNPFVRVPNRFK